MLFGPRVMAPREEGVPPAEVAPVEEAVPISDTQPTRIKPVEEPAEPFVTAKLPEAEPEKPEVPEWLRGVEAPAEAPIEMTAAGPGSPMDDEAAFAWLEGLAARMGADEAMLLSPEERREEPPEWVQKAAEAAAEAPLEEIQPEVPVSGFEAVPAGEPATEAEIQPVEAFAFEERPVEAEMAPAEEFGFEELPAEAEIQPVEAVAAEEIPVEAQIPPAEEFVFEEIPLEAGVPPAEGFVFEEIPFEAEALPAEELPIEAALFTELEGITPVEERMEEAPAIEEAPAEAVEPMAGLILEETEPVSEEAPPELPSWLAGAEAAQPAEEEAAWTPPEEEAEVELEQPIPAETQLAAEPFRLEEIEAVQLDLNRAGLSELERLPGVGFTRAQAIITYRQAFGAFSSVDDLINIAGFDPSLVDSLKRHLTIAEAQPVEALAEGVDIHQVTLIQARNALIQSDTNKALLHYLNLIRAQQLLPEVIQDLNEALYRFPVDISIWEALGDAHVRAGHLQESLDAYTKAEELIR
jgi:competence ComEA-like helix-hairpin-helix protein